MSHGCTHVLIPSISWPPETFLAQLIRGLADAGIEISIAVDGPLENDWSHPNVNRIWAPSWNVGRIIRLVRLLALAFRAAVRLRGNLIKLQPVDRLTERGLECWYRSLPFVGRSFDVIYFPWNSGAWQHPRLVRSRTPTVVSCRGSQINVAPHNPQRASFRVNLPSTFAEASVVHCVSENIKRRAAEFGLDSTKARVIRPGVDPELFRPDGCRDQHSDGALRVVATGSLTWCKGFEYALSAIRTLVDQGITVQFRLIGDGPDRQRIMYTIQDLGLTTEVWMLGRLQPCQVAKELQAADVFVLSSLSEGISNAALEAMACGLPVVSTDCGGMREAISEGVEGFLVPPRDPRAMAEALSRIAAEPQRARQMGVAARKRILREFTLKQQIAAFAELIRMAHGRN